LTAIFWAGFLLCAALGVSVILRHDLHDREPPLAVALCILTGFLVTPFLGRLEDGILYSLSATPSIASIALVAGIVEESARTLLVTGFSLVDRRRFNDPMDGIVYGSLLGIGMAAFETFLYTGDGFPLDGEILAREAVRLYGHAVLGGIAGYPAGILRMGTRAAPLALSAWPLAAAALHFLLDLGALAHATTPGRALAGTAVVLGAVLAATLLHGGLAVVASERSRLLFAPGSALRLVRWPLDLVPGMGRRREP
jgi:RsiW-degrading membrane proteinase PrsW (M82 family)